MQKIIGTLLLSLLLSLSILHAQQSQNLTLLSHWNNTNLPHVDGDQIWNDLMGWKDTVKNREYIIAGSSDSIYFFDITDPTQMIIRDVEEGHSRYSINRDYDIYDHYVYCVSDRSSPLGSLQIFDMQYLPDSVHKVYDNDTFSINSHTLFIEWQRKRLYLCGNTHKPAGNRSMAVLTLDDPESPQYIGELDKNLGCSYTHEVFVKNDTAYCSCGTPGLFIFDLRDMNHQQVIGSITPPYPYNGYNHSSWLDSTGRYLMFTDENQGNYIKVYDMADIGNPNIVTVFNSHPNALPHNAYWKGQYAYVSAYEDGVYVFDLKDIASYTMSNQPPMAGFYDTYPLNADGVYNGFHGCWGVWPFLPSGNIIASDISEGIFVLQPGPHLAVNETLENIRYVNAWPNPFSTQLNISLSALRNETVQVQLIDLYGKTIYQSHVDVTQGNTNFTLPLAQLAQGPYFLRCISSQGVLSRTLLKTN